ncbi:putative serine protease K12H4.7 [Macrobrachium nipponense]|uniref:putative serine protease K12H4.7 n=1 Tax=Macrobrachium nipponense TaxID=159736 RepID=UPI0030C83E01
MKSFITTSGCSSTLLATVWLVLGLPLLGESLSMGYKYGRPRNGFMYPPPKPKGVTLPPDQWFVQKLDHFNPTDTSTWSQRYFTNSSFYKPGGPVFLMIGGEGPANPIWMVEGAWIPYAERLNAYLISLEHRYYGKSHPTEDVSVENLVYLSSEQALADLATFTVAMKEKLGLKDNKWIAFGGSYPGSLAAWYRLKYPHLVHGSIASSAPIVAQIDFREYLEVVRDALATVSEACNTAIKEATRQLQLLMAHRVGWQNITKRFKLCVPLDGTKKLDVSNLFATLAGYIEEVVQYNKDNRGFEGVKGVNITIETLCNILMDEKKGPAIARYGEINDMFLALEGESCLDYTYDNMIKEFQATSWENNTDVGGRSWIYQTCTEFGFYQGSDSHEQPFGDEFPLQFYTRQCQDIFGPRISPEVLNAGVRRTNAVYGGHDLKVTRVVFPNGSIDPWHALGVTSNISDEATAIFIDGTAHCANMYPASTTDPPQLTQAREKIFSLLQKWLKD